MIEGEYELLNDAIFKIVPTCHAEKNLKKAIILTVPRQRNSTAALASVRIWWQQSWGGGYANWSTFAGVYGQSAPQVDEFFLSLLSGCNKRARSEPVRQLKVGALCTTTGTAARPGICNKATSKSLAPKGKKPKAVCLYLCLCLCLCVWDRMNGWARSLVLPSTAFAVGLQISVQ